MKVRYAPLIRKWHVWLMGPVDRTRHPGLQVLNEVPEDLRSGSIRQWWREAFELPMSQAVLDAIDSTP